MGEADHQPPSRQTTMNRTFVLETGLSLRHVALKWILPGTVVVLLLASGLAWYVQRGLQAERWSMERATVNAVFHSHEMITGTRPQLAQLALSSGFERIWVVDATGRVLASSLGSDVGKPLDAWWWNRVQEAREGFEARTVRYGSANMTLFSRYDASLGRWVIAVAESSSSARSVPVLWLIVPGMGLMMWFVCVTLVFFVVKRGLHAPLEELDQVLLASLRGEDMSHSSLDRLEARLVPRLGGHATSVLDVVRQSMQGAGRVKDLETRLQSILDGLPGHVVVLAADETVLAVGRRVMDARHGRPFPDTLRALEEVLPADRIRRWLRRTGGGGAGVQQVVIDGKRTLSLQPVAWNGRAAVLACVSESGDTDMPDGDGFVDILHAAGVHAIVFDEEGRFLFQTAGLDASDLKSFREECLVSDGDRAAFASWLQERPDETSIPLSLQMGRALVGPLEWRASEILFGGREAGFLWAVEPEKKASAEPIT